MQEALYGIAKAMEGHLEELKAEREAAWHLTWGYVYGPMIVEVQTAAEMAEQGAA